MFHLTQEYITGSFRNIKERFDALEQRLTQQTKGLENHTHAKVKQSSMSEEPIRLQLSYQAGR